MEEENQVRVLLNKQTNRNSLHIFVRIYNSDFHANKIQLPAQTNQTTPQEDRPPSSTPKQPQPHKTLNYERDVRDSGETVFFAQQFMVEKWWQVRIRGDKSDTI